MSLLSRLNDFQPGTLVQSAQVDAELNQLVNALSGGSTNKQISIVSDQPNVDPPALRIKTTNVSGRPFEIRDSSDNIVFRIDSVGNVQIGTITAGGGKSLSVIGDSPSFALLDNNGEDLLIALDTDVADIIMGNLTHLRLRGGANDDSTFLRPVKLELNSITSVLGGQYAHSFSTIGNVGAGQDDLHSFTLPANFFAKDGDTLQYISAGDFANNANPKTLEALIGGTQVFTSTAVVFQNGGWNLRFEFMRIDSDSIRVSFLFSVNAASGNLAYGRVVQINGLNFAAPLVLKITGQDTGGVPVDNSVTQTMSILRKFDS